MKKRSIQKNEYKTLRCKNSTAVVILCGGVSRRLDVSKALLQANGKPLFKVVEENLSPLGLPVYLVSKVPFESGDIVYCYLLIRLYAHLL